MADRDRARAESTDEVKSDLDQGLKSCMKLLASYRAVFTRDQKRLGSTPQSTKSR